MNAKTVAAGRASDLRGAGKLIVDAVAGVTDIVEDMHRNIAAVSPIVGAAPSGRTRGIPGLVYRSVRGVTKVVGFGLDAALARLAPLLGGGALSPRREAVLAALNGVLGDYLVATDNPLAIPMRLRCGGRPLVPDAPTPTAAMPVGGRKVVVLVHGLCMSDMQWNRAGHDHGEVLARELGYTPVYLHYNTGLHTSVNGRAFADQLEALLAHWPDPVEELAIVTHSMGGLVARSACHYGLAAGHGWPQRLRAMVFMGTPHHGAPLERGGSWVDVILGATPYAAPIGRLGRLRSAGITDLRHGNVLDTHWNGRDRFARGRDRREPVPLPPGVQCYAIAATTGRKNGDLRDRLLGDGLVPVASALGEHKDPDHALAIAKSRQWIGYSMHHMDLLSRADVSERIVRWLAPVPRRRRAAGFTLLEMVVVVAVVAILALMTLPTFIDKQLQDQINEALPLTDIARKPIEASWSATQAFPPDNASAGLPAPDKVVSNLVSAMAVQDGVIHVTFGNRAHGLLRGNVLTLRPAVVEGAPVVPVAWVCGFAAGPDKMTIHGENRTNVPPRYLPVKCRQS